jgi:hypothetical protein
MLSFFKQVYWRLIASESQKKEAARKAIEEGNHAAALFYMGFGSIVTVKSNGTVLERRFKVPQ